MKQVFYCILLVCSSSLAQTLDWVKVNGNSWPDEGRAIVTDVNNNVIVAGKWAGDIFVMKFNATGTLQWFRLLNGPTDQDGAYGVDVDVAGNVYVTGYFFGTVDFDPGSGVYNLSSGNYRDVFILKLNSSGNFLWAKQYGGDRSDEGLGIVLDILGDIYICGYFKDTADFDPGPGQYNLIATALNENIFIAKMNNAGDLIWAKGLGGGIANAIDYAPDGSLCVTGHFYASVDFDPDTSSNILTSMGGTDIFIARYDSSGSLGWVEGFGNFWNDEGLSLCADNSSNMVVSGVYIGTVDFDPGSGVNSWTTVNSLEDAFVTKYDSSGNYLWAGAFGANAPDEATDVWIDFQGSVYITGYYSNPVDFDIGTGSFWLSGSAADAFVSKLNANGGFVWACEIANSPSNDYSYAITLDGNSSILTTGTFQQTSDFDPTSGIYTLPTYMATPYDIFTHKMFPSLLTSISGYFNNVALIYPNPNSGTFQLTIGIQQYGSLSVFDLLGKRIETFLVEEGNSTVELKNVKQGVYILEFRDQSGAVFWSKIIIE